MSDELTTALGGVTLEVMHEDGKTETVFVRKLRVKHMPQYLACVGNESRQVELVCERPPGWMETLTADSQAELADLVQELNLSFFERWFKRTMREVEVLKPGASAALNQQIENAIRQAGAVASVSPDSSPPSPTATT